MTEEELLYHFPYKIDKELTFRYYADNNKGFVRRYIQNYDGTNIEEFIERKTSLSSEQATEFYYDYENYRRWSEWYNAGRNIFAFSKELLSMLDKTDVSDIRPESFNLPYDIFYLSLKPMMIPISQGSDKIIEGVYVDHNIWNMNGEHPEGYCDLSLYFVGDFKDFYIEFLPNVTARLESGVPGQYDEFEEGSFWNVWLNFEKAVGRETMKQAIDHFLIEQKQDIFPHKGMSREANEYEKRFLDSQAALLDRTINLVVNCLLYLSQPTDKKDVELKLPKGLPGNLDKQLSFAKKPSEVKKIERKYEELGFSKINYVGQSFANSHRNLFNGGTVQSHWRRGHWREQKFGEKFSEKKIIWILPTIVNAHLGEPIKGHLYDV